MFYMAYTDQHVCHPEVQSVEATNLSPQSHMRDVECGARAIFHLLGFARSHVYLEDIWIPGYNLLGMDPKFHQFRDTVVEFVASLEKLLAVDNSEVTGMDLTATGAYETCEQKINHGQA